MSGRGWGRGRVGLRQVEQGRGREGRRGGCTGHALAGRTGAAPWLLPPPTPLAFCLPGLPAAGEGVLALPKLNLQFLTFHDYLLRNFNLFRLEAT